MIWSVDLLLLYIERMGQMRMPLSFSRLLWITWLTNILAQATYYVANLLETHACLFPLPAHITTKKVIFKWFSVPSDRTWNGFGEFELIIRIKSWERENIQSYSSAQNPIFLDLKIETLMFFQSLKNAPKNRNWVVRIDLKSLKRRSFRNNVSTQTLLQKF